jgi:hypothetical protein
MPSFDFQVPYSQVFSWHRKYRVCYFYAPLFILVTLSRTRRCTLGLFGKFKKKKIPTFQMKIFC